MFQEHPEQESPPRFRPKGLDIIRDALLFPLLEEPYEKIQTSDEYSPELLATNLDNLTEQTIFDLGENAISKARSLQLASTNPDSRHKLSVLIDSVADGVANLLFCGIDRNNQVLRLILSLALGVSTATHTLTRATDIQTTSHGQFETASFSDIVDPTIFHQYEGESASLIDRVYDQYGVYLNSPKHWDNEINLPISQQILQVIETSLSNLPSDYFPHSHKPLPIILIRTPNTNSVAVGGHYINENDSEWINLYIPETFNPSDQIPGYQGEIYGTSGNQLKAVIAHEFTHRWTLNICNDDLIAKWLFATGWVLDPNGNYLNLYPQELMPEAEANTDPYEDIAVSVSRALINPDTISQRRQTFLKTHQPWSTWKSPLLTDAYTNY